jgi:mono/diheme cytochrome c family protein
VVATPSVSTNAPATAASATAPTNQVAAPAVSPATPAAGQTNTTAAAGDSQAGKALFVSAGCAACHTMEGQGGKVGPDLSNEAKLGRSSQWLIAQITDPTKHNPATKMPAHQNLTQPQLKGLTDYILNPSTSPAAPGAGTAANASATPAQTNESPDAAVASASVVKMIGDPKHGAVLFDLDCAKCHGKAGVGQVPNPGSQAGVVPALAPISRGLFTNDPVVFAANIDRVIQQGATSPGSGPALQMPAFGTTRSLTVQEIANIEAYVLSLNGVDAARIIHPGITPLRFVEGTVALFAVALLAIGGLWIRSRASLPTQTGGYTTPEEFQNLKHEVAALKHKLEEMETRNPKDSSGSIDSQQ